MSPPANLAWVREGFPHDPKANMVEISFALSLDHSTALWVGIGAVALIRTIWRSKQVTSPIIVYSDYKPKRTRKRREQPELTCGRIVSAKAPKGVRGPVTRLQEQ